MFRNCDDLFLVRPETHHFHMTLLACETHAKDCGTLTDTINFIRAKRFGQSVWGCRMPVVGSGRTMNCGIRSDVVWRTTNGALARAS